MRQLYKPTIEELELLRDEATGGGRISEAQWAKKICGVMADMLKNDPRRYRSYGPYWWVMKQAMLDNGVAQFGEFIDREWFELVDYGNPFHNLLAAWMYQDGALENGLMYSHAHNVAFLPEEEKVETPDVQEYTLVDEEMEQLALEKGMRR